VIQAAASPSVTKIQGFGWIALAMAWALSSTCAALRLFADGWPALIRGSRELDVNKREAELARLRDAALAEIYQQRGLGGVAQFARRCSQLGQVGLTLARLGLDDETLATWVVTEAGDLRKDDQFLNAIYGLFRALEAEPSERVLRLAVSSAQAANWDIQRLARLLSLARPERRTWDIASGLGSRYEEAYWSEVQPGYWLRPEDPDWEVALARLVRIGRPRTALRMSFMGVQSVTPSPRDARTLRAR
jgi:hypothetical protein